MAAGAAQTKVGGKVAKEYLSRFPDIATKTLARKAYGENKSVWPSFDACYQMVRYYRGAMGQRGRENIKDKSAFREHRKPGEGGFRKLPDGLVSIKDWGHVQIDTPGNWLAISDIHVPYHDKRALGAIWKEAKKRKVVGILLNGDIADCHCISRWQTDPRKRDFWGELKVLHQLFASLREDFPRADIVWKWGNHEERYDVYMQVKAPELLNIPDFQYGSLARTEQHGIRIVNEKRPVKLGKLWTIHGHEYKGGYNSPVNPARGLYNKTKASCLAGHLHQSSSHSEGDIAKHLTTTWTTGCLSELHPEYAVINKWNHGAAIVELSQDGAYGVTNYRIIDGQIYS